VGTVTEGHLDHEFNPIVMAHHHPIRDIPSHSIMLALNAIDGVNIALAEQKAFTV
jgi:hypothetical protein